MQNCPHYKIETQSRTNNQIGGAPITIKWDTPWCSHHHSPARREIATGTINGEKILKCAGDFAQCQIPAHAR